MIFAGETKKKLAYEKPTAIFRDILNIDVLTVSDNPFDGEEDEFDYNGTDNGDANIVI